MNGGTVAVGANSTLDYITGATNGNFNATLTGGTNATFTKEGTTTLNIIGNESGFNGVVNITQGALAYNTANGGTLFGTNTQYNIAGGASLDITTNGANENVNISNLSTGAHSAELNKNGLGTLTLVGDNSGFGGIANIDGGTLSYTPSNENSFFNSDAVINVDNTAGQNSTFKYTSLSGDTLGPNSFPEINLIDGGTFDYTAGVGETYINNGFYNSVSGNNNLVFDGANATKITLNSGFNANDTATFKNSNLYLASGLTTIGNAVVLDNSTLNMMDRTITDYTFSNLTSQNSSKISLDVSLGSTPEGDTLSVATGSGILNLTRFAIIDDNGIFDTPDQSKTVQVIKNGANSNLSLAAAGATISDGEILASSPIIKFSLACVTLNSPVEISAYAKP